MSGEEPERNGLCGIHWRLASISATTSVGVDIHHGPRRMHILSFDIDVLGSIGFSAAHAVPG